MTPLKVSAEYVRLLPHPPQLLPVLSGPMKFQHVVMERSAGLMMIFMFCNWGLGAPSIVTRMICMLPSLDSAI